MSSDPVHFIRKVDETTTFPGSIHELIFGIAEELEARVASPPALRQMAEQLRESADRITDAVLSNLSEDDGVSRSVPATVIPIANVQLLSNDGNKLVSVPEGYDEAVAFVTSRGYTGDGAHKVVIREGVTTILTSKARQEAEAREEAEKANTAAATTETAT